MKNPSRKKSRKKEDQLLLSSNKKQTSSDFVDLNDTKGYDEFRDDSQTDGWLPLPIQPTQLQGSKGGNSSGPREGSKGNGLLEESSQRDSIQWSNVPAPLPPPPPQKPLPTSKSRSRSSKGSRKSNSAGIPPRSSPEKRPPLRNEASGDIFVFQDFGPSKSSDSLDDLLEAPEEAKNRVNSFKIDEGSSSSNDQSVHSYTSASASLGIPVDPMFQKRGILIVDPKKNGEIYHMDEDNKSLTDKDLIIIGQGNGDDDDDNRSMMSNLTEVTYQKTKEERVKLIVDHLKSTTGFTESNPLCGAFNFPIPEESTKPDDPTKNAEAPKKIRALHEPQDTRYFGQDSSLLIKSLVSVSTRGPESVDFGSYKETICVCITRIYLSLQDNGDNNGLRCTYNEPKLCHDLGVRLHECRDGQAIVIEVLPESTAQRSGVKVGDKLSFAVPLNNTFQGYEKACDFISRLELIGMRTSYREIFDMFLSKTSSGWPVATVFRRVSEGLLAFERLPMGMPSVNLNIDILRASAFFHEIVTRSREYDYQRESSGVFEIIRGNIESFMQKPLYRESQESHAQYAQQADIEGAAESLGLQNSVDARVVFVPSIASGIGLGPRQFFFTEARRSSLLTWYTESSQALFYLKFNRTFGGSGILISRLKEDSWSAPCAVNGNLVGSSFQLISEAMEFMIFVRDMKSIQKIRSGEKITVGGTDDQKRVLVISKIEDHFCIERNVLFSLQERPELNRMLYCKKNTNNADATATHILDGKVPNPDEAMAFYGALRRLELPSTMYPHPTPPPNLAKFNLNDWKIRDSCKASSELEHPFDEESITTLRDLLKAFKDGHQLFTEEVNEFEVFMQKFKQMLFDGVTIDRAWPYKDEDGGNLDESSRRTSGTLKVTLKLNQVQKGHEMEEHLNFISRSNGNGKDDIIDFTNPSGMSRINCVSESINMRNITKISQNMPRSFLSNRTSAQEARKIRKRFVSVKTESGKKVLFLARTGKDASLLSCGIKLLVERSLERV